MMLRPLSLSCLLSLSSAALGYGLVREYRGANFFDDRQGNPLWDFYGSWDNLTLCVRLKTLDRFLTRNTSHRFFGDNLSYPVNDTNRGDVFWSNRSGAYAQKLAYVNEKSQVVMKVDNTAYVPWNEKRNSVRVESRHLYGVGSLWIVDISHVPYGCSVSPLNPVHGSRQ